MGESKRRADRASALTKALTEEGKLIEAGFAMFANMVISKDAPALQLSEMQLAFMAGAEHVWSSSMNMLDEGEEPTEDDLRRMDLIQRELDQWRAKLTERVNQPKGNKPRLEFEAQQPHERLGDAPVESEYHAQMTAVCGAIDELFNGEAKGPAKKVGFVLMVFPYGDDSGRCNYMSNGADRKDVVTLMKEMIARFEGQPETSGRA